MEERQRDLRKKILEIQRNPDIDANNKRFLLQKLIGNLPEEQEDNTDTIEEVLEDSFMEDLVVSYHDQSQGQFGCKHYSRKCMKIANCCQKPVSCRVCHDEDYGHKIDRFQTKHVVCMECKFIQRAGENCKNCGILFAKYYCSVCIFYTDADSIYHCNDCGICRVGKYILSR